MAELVTLGVPCQLGCHRLGHHACIAAPVVIHAATPPQGATAAAPQGASGRRCRCPKLQQHPPPLLPVLSAWRPAGLLVTAPAATSGLAVALLLRCPRSLLLVVLLLLLLLRLFLRQLLPCLLLLLHGRAPLKVNAHPLGWQR